MRPPERVAGPTYEANAGAPGTTISAAPGVRLPARGLPAALRPDREQDVAPTCPHKIVLMNVRLSSPLAAPNRTFHEHDLVQRVTRAERRAPGRARYRTARPAQRAAS